MAEAHEQPALLHQDVDEAKKPGRTKSTTRPRRTTASKTGSRRAAKQTKVEEANQTGAKNGTAKSEGQDAPSSNNAEIAPVVVAEQPPVQLVEVTERQNDRKSSVVKESMDEPAAPDPAPARSQEPAPIVEAPRYEPLFGEGLIEVSGKGFGFLRDPKRNYVQSPQDIFVTPEVVRKHSLRDGLWI